MIRLKTILVVLAIFLGGQLFAEGIDFKQISFEEALDKAQQENKLVFIDFYTEWCGPCKMMANNVFPNERVGEIYNREFINIQLDAEKEGKAAAQKYGVNAYPTTVFINGKGEMVYKKVGYRDIAAAITMGKEAIDAVSNGYSMADLKAEYESKKNDERFLKLYIAKMIDYREEPYDAIEAWLKVQTEIKENDVDMMEFLFNHRKYLLVDGKAEEILKANYNEYFDIATRAEEKILESMQATLVYNTRQVAYKKRDVKLLRAFITNWKELPGSAEKTDELKGYELNYCFLAKDAEGYKQLATAYLDSMMAARTLGQIRADDQATYDDYKATKYAPSIIGNKTLEKMAKGVEATAQKDAIVNIGSKYLKFAENKKEYKKLLSWIDYGDQLAPGDSAMEKLRVDVLGKK